MSADKVIKVAELQLTVRHMTSQELAQLVAMTTDDGWTVSLDDLTIMFDATPDGFIGAFLDGVTLITHVLLINYSASLSVLGLYITKTSYRGQGIGSVIFRHALELAGDRTIVLDSLTGKSALYQRYGFRFIDVKCTRVIGFVDHSKLVHQTAAGFKVDKVTPHNIDSVIKFDENVILTNRSSFIRGWLLSENSVSLRAVNWSDVVVGYIVIRPDYVTKRPISFKICGFYANDVIIAGELLAYLLETLPHMAQVWARFACPNETIALSCYAKCGIDTVQRDWTVLKMVRGECWPAADWSKVYAVVNSINTYI